MKLRLTALLAVACLLLTCMVGCGGGGEQEPEYVDYVAETKLDMNSDTVKQEVTVKNYVDGDTTHFFVPTSIRDTGVLKARYMGINTPESTGKIEEWGKKASNFTKEKLMNAESIYVESDNGQWNLDSTGDRHIVWVWYKPQGGTDYRCLNLELIQNGLSISCGTVDDRYGEQATAAFQQAKNQKLNVFSGQPDPDFFYGEAYEMDLKNLRTNVALYKDAKVAFEGVVTRINNNSAYVEEYDGETDMYYGMAVYYGFATGELLNILKIGNRVRVVGTVAYYETGGAWQVSGLNYRVMKPDDPSNTILLSEGHKAANVETDPAKFANGKVNVEVMTSLDSDELQTKTFDYADLAMSTSISMKGLKVVDIYTTHNGGDNDGAMTLTCKAADGTMIDVRTIVLRDAEGKMLTQADYINKTIDVVGIVDYFSGAYQIKVLTAEDITVH